VDASDVLDILEHVRGIKKIIYSIKNILNKIQKNR
jgi:hypothetical protein